MENTLENKAKFFAQYWGQSVLMFNQLPLVSKHFVSEDFEKYWLVLKPLSSITDEDAIEVAKIMLLSYREYEINSLSGVGMYHSIISIESKNKSNIDYLPYLKCNINFKYFEILGYSFNQVSHKMGLIEYQNSLCAFQYLQSKGYALPWMGLSREKLVEYGWVKLKEG